MQQYSPADRLTRRPRSSVRKGAGPPFGDATGAHTRPERAAHGERHGSAKLDWDTVREIRARLAAGTVTQAALAKEYQIAKSTLNALVKGKTWQE
jgi:hypothetical protein